MKIIFHGTSSLTSDTSRFFMKEKKNNNNKLSFFIKKLNKFWNVILKSKIQTMETFQQYKYMLYISEYGILHIESLLNLQKQTYYIWYCINKFNSKDLSYAQQHLIRKDNMHKHLIFELITVKWTVFIFRKWRIVNTGPSDILPFTMQ